MTIHLNKDDSKQKAIKTAQNLKTAQTPPDLNFRVVEAAIRKNLSDLSPSQVAHSLRTIREGLAATDIKPSMDALQALLQACKTGPVPPAMLNGSVDSELRLLDKQVKAAIQANQNWLNSLSPLTPGADNSDWHFNEGARAGHLESMAASIKALNAIIQSEAWADVYVNW